MDNNQHLSPAAQIKTEIFDTCRACLHENNQLKSMDENNLRLTYKEFTTIEVPESRDSLVPKLCNECVDVLNFFTNFKQKCLRSNDYFLQLAVSSHLSPKPPPPRPPTDDLSLAPIAANTPVHVKEEALSEAARQARLKIETVIIDELIEIAPVGAPDKDGGHDAGDARKLKRAKRDIETRSAARKEKRGSKKEKRRKNEEPVKSESEMEDVKDEEESGAENSEDEFEDGVESADEGSDGATPNEAPKKKKKRKMIIDENGEKVYSAQWLAVLEWRDKKEKSSIVDENGQKRFTCDLCPRTYDTMHMLRRHETRHKFYKGVVCDLCGLYVCSPAALRKHKSFKHSNSRPYTCDKCDGAFKSKWGLHEHMRTLHSEERNHSCPQCGRMFKSNSRLHAHRKMVHEAERRYHCLICDKKFKKSYVLKRHQLKHSGDKAFSCVVCAKPFSTKHACTAHQKIHSLEKNKYLCRICSELFSNKRHARKHIREAHPGESVVSQVAVLEPNETAATFQGQGEVVVAAAAAQQQQIQQVLAPMVPTLPVQVMPMEQVAIEIQLQHLQPMPPSC